MRINPHHETKENSKWLLSLLPTFHTNNLHLNIRGLNKSVNHRSTNTKGVLMGTAE